MPQGPTPRSRLKFTKVAVTVSVGVGLLLASACFAIAFSISNSTTKFPVLFKGWIQDQRSKDIAHINASLSVQGLQQAIAVVQHVDQRPIFSIFNPPLASPVWSEPADPRNFDQAKLVVIAGENYPIGTSRFTVYTLTIKDNAWLIANQENRMAMRD